MGVTLAVLALPGGRLQAAKHLWLFVCLIGLSLPPDENFWVFLAFSIAWLLPSKVVL